MKIAIVGAGWAGMAAAVAAIEAGHHATVFEASRAVGGRARVLNGTLPDGTDVTLDNGQHILIGAYSDTLALMRTVGVQPEDALLRLPLTLQFQDGSGLVLPKWPSPLDAFAGILKARGWSWGDKWSLLRTAIGWQNQGFRCAPHATVADLCASPTPAVMETLMEPLCVSALNTPAHQASGTVFLRVLQDSLFGGTGGSNLLLPRVDLGALFPEAAARWVQHHGCTVHTGTRVQSLQPTAEDAAPWQVNGEAFDAVVWATSASNAVLALSECAQTAPETIATPIQQWVTQAQALQFEAITTVYAFATNARLKQPMLALRSNSTLAPAQFVFDRGQLGGPRGLLAWVVSASHGERDVLEAQVLQQARDQFGLEMQAVQTVVEKRATFACTPALQRPGACIAQGLVACGDYVDGPYPATLEGAVRSGRQAISLLSNP
ncbi:MAG: FAD-dependent oxidoreductase [Rhodoferax sp.]|nr:FAD-dependent oxidoreductase [Rhodoferax sp.]